MQIIASMHRASFFLRFRRGAQICLPCITVPTKVGSCHVLLSHYSTLLGHPVHVQSYRVVGIKCAIKNDRHLHRLPQEWKSVGAEAEAVSSRQLHAPVAVHLGHGRCEEKEEEGKGNQGDLSHDQKKSALEFKQIFITWWRRGC